jgi:hypothetical protein
MDKQFFNVVPETPVSLAKDRKPQLTLGHFKDYVDWTSERDRLTATGLLKGQKLETRAAGFFVGPEELSISHDERPAGMVLVRSLTGKLRNGKKYPLLVVQTPQALTIYDPQNRAVPEVQIPGLCIDVISLNPGQLYGNTQDGLTRFYFEQFLNGVDLKRRTPQGGHTHLIGNGILSRDGETRYLIQDETAEGIPIMGKFRTIDFVASLDHLLLRSTGAEGYRNIRESSAQGLPGIQYVGRMADALRSIHDTGRSLDTLQGVMVSDLFRDVNPLEVHPAQKDFIVYAAVNNAARLQLN